MTRCDHMKSGTTHETKIISKEREKDKETIEAEKQGKGDISVCGASKSFSKLKELVQRPCSTWISYGSTDTSC